MKPEIYTGPMGFHGLCQEFTLPFYLWLIYECRQHDMLGPVPDDMGGRVDGRGLLQVVADRPRPRDVSHGMRQRLLPQATPPGLHTLRGGARLSG